MHPHRGCVVPGVGHAARSPTSRRPSSASEREFFIDNLLVRIHFIIVMIRWTGLAPWELEFPFPGSLTSTFLALPQLIWAPHAIHLEQDSVHTLQCKEHRDL